MSQRPDNSHLPHSRQYARSQCDASAFAALIGSGKGIVPLAVGIGSGMESTHRRIHPTNLSLHHSGECLARKEPIPASKMIFKARRSMSARLNESPIVFPPVRDVNAKAVEIVYQYTDADVIIVGYYRNGRRVQRHKNLHWTPPHSRRFPDRGKTSANTVNALSHTDITARRYAPRFHTCKSPDWVTLLRNSFPSSAFQRRPALDDEGCAPGLGSLSPTGRTLIHISLTKAHTDD